MAENNARKRSAWTEAVAAAIRAERAARHLTQDQVIALSGIPRSTYLRLEKGTRVPDAQQLHALCEGYEMPVSALMRQAELWADRIDSHEAAAERALAKLPPDLAEEARRIDREQRAAQEEDPRPTVRPGGVVRSATTGS